MGKIRGANNAIKCLKTMLHRLNDPPHFEVFLSMNEQCFWTTQKKQNISYLRSGLLRIVREPLISHGFQPVGVMNKNNK